MGGDNWHPYEVDFNWGVGGALTAYDLPDLIACMVPRRVAMWGINDQMLELASEDLINTEMEFPNAVYAAKHVSANLRIIPSNEDLNSTIKWCFESR